MCELCETLDTPGGGLKVKPIQLMTVKELDEAAQDIISSSRLSYQNIEDMLDQKYVEGYDAGYEFALDELDET